MFRVTLLAIAVGAVGSSNSLFAQDVLPPEAKAYLDFLEGGWQFTNRQGQRGTGNVEWAAGKHCMIANTEAGGFKSTGLIGWDPEEEVIVETWHRSDGTRVMNRITDFTQEGWNYVGTIHSPKEPPQTLELDVKIAADGNSFSATTKDGKKIMYRREENRN